jgi:predicted metal-dependent phosphoesterase TrpH
MPVMPETWSSADIHLHTTGSDGLGTPRDVLDWVSEHTDLSVIAITDHNSVDGAHEAAALAKEYRVEVIVGQEVDTMSGHVIGLWAPERIEPGASAQDTVDAIHAQGGIAVVAHPFAPRWWAKHGLCRGDRTIYDCVDFDAFEISNSTPLIFHANWLARRYMRDHEHRFAVTGGSDAHILSAIGASRTLFPGTTAADLRIAIEARTTRVDRKGFWLARNLRYAGNIRAILARDYEQQTLKR